MFTVDKDTTVARVYGYSTILGFGSGLFIQASFSVAQAVVSPDMVPSAVGFITCAQVSGSTIALAIANSVFLNESQDSIAKILPDLPLKEIQEAISGAGSKFLLTLSPELQGQVLTAIVDAISKTYILVITGGALAAVLSLGMKRERLFMAVGGAA